MGRIEKSRVEASWRLCAVHSSSFISFSTCTSSSSLKVKRNRHSRQTVVIGTLLSPSLSSHFTFPPSGTGFSSSCPCLSSSPMQQTYRRHYYFCQRVILIPFSLAIVLVAEQLPVEPLSLQISSLLQPSWMINIFRSSFLFSFERRRRRRQAEEKAASTVAVVTPHLVNLKRHRSSDCNRNLQVRIINPETIVFPWMVLPPLAKK